MVVYKSEWFKSSLLKFNAGLMMAVLAISTLSFGAPVGAVPLPTINGSSWSQCVSPGTQQPWSGCFNSGTSTYAWVNSNVRYSIPYYDIDSGSVNVKINYQQKSTALPANYAGYQVKLLFNTNDTQVLKSVANLTLPAAGPGVAKTYDVAVTVPSMDAFHYANPRSMELQWSNDAADADGDANLQIDSIVLDQTAYQGAESMTGNAYSQCVNPNYQDQWSGCFDTISSNPAVASTVAYETANITYPLPQAIGGGTESELFTMEIKYRQHKSKPLPAGYTAYQVAISNDGSTPENGIFSLPAGAPDAVQTYTLLLSTRRFAPISQVQMRWLNDAADANGDANLQIDSISLRQQ